MSNQSAASDAITVMTASALDDLTALEKAGYAKAAPRSFPTLDSMVTRRRRGRSGYGRSDLLQDIIGDPSVELPEEVRRALPIMLGLDQPTVRSSVQSRIDRLRSQLPMPAHDSIRTRDRGEWLKLLSVAAVAHLGLTTRLLQLQRVPSPIGRQRELSEISRLLEQSRPAFVDCDFVALTGMPGVGKTTVATEWLRRNLPLFDVVTMVDGSSQASIKRDLSATFRALNKDDGDDVGDGQLGDLLADGRRWAIMLDGLNEPEDLDLLSTLRGGLILCTTQRRGWVPKSHQIEILPLQRSDSMRLLGGSAFLLDGEAVDRIAELVGDHPGALAQISGIIRMSGRRLEDIESDLQQRLAEVLQKIPVQRPGSPPLGAMAAIHVALHDLERNDPDALLALQVLASFQTGMVSVDILRLAPSEVDSRIVPDSFTDSLGRSKLISNLIDRSLLLTGLTGHPNFWVHDLISVALGEDAFAVLVGLRIVGELLDLVFQFAPEEITQQPVVLKSEPVDHEIVGQGIIRRSPDGNYAVDPETLHDFATSILAAGVFNWDPVDLLVEADLESRTKPQILYLLLAASSLATATFNSLGSVQEGTASSKILDASMTVEAIYLSAALWILKMHSEEAIDMSIDLDPMINRESTFVFSFTDDQIIIDVDK